jgi:hypothetical protein
MIRKFALIFGIIYVIGGISGFIPALNPHHADVRWFNFSREKTLCKMRG